MSPSPSLIDKAGQDAGQNRYSSPWPLCLYYADPALKILIAFLFWKHFWISCTSLLQACVKWTSYYFPFKICQMCNTLYIVSLHGYSLMCYLICILHVLSIYLPAFPPQYRKSPASSENINFFRFEVKRETLTFSTVSNEIEYERSTLKSQTQAGPYLNGIECVFQIINH